MVQTGMHSGHCEIRGLQLHLKCNLRTMSLTSSLGVERTLEYRGSAEVVDRTRHIQRAQGPAHLPGAALSRCEATKGRATTDGGRTAGWGTTGRGATDGGPQPVGRG